MSAPLVIKSCCESTVTFSGTTIAGGGQLMQGNGPPVAAPLDPTQPAVWTDLLTGQMTTWNVGTQTWLI